jgi:ketosteroid isomerase-like protein
VPPSRIDDLEAIRQLTIMYAYHIDRFELEPLVELFAQDALWNAESIGLGAFKGHDSIREFFTHDFDTAENHMHLITNQVVTRLDGDEAEGFCYFFGKGQLKAGGNMTAGGRYDDHYVRTDDRWRFQRRALIALIPPELEGLAMEDRA